MPVMIQLLYTIENDWKLEVSVDLLITVTVKRCWLYYLLLNVQVIDYLLNLHRCCS